MGCVIRRTEVIHRTIESCTSGFGRHVLPSASGALRIVSVVGARPNFTKIAPILRAINKHNRGVSTSGTGRGALVAKARIIDHLLIHTEQHYDNEMSKIFFEDLELPEPNVCLGIGSGTHAEQTGRTMIEFEKVLLEEKPDAVIVVGDVNSTLAAALTATKLCISVAHVEAGLRSFDREMPEEINRILTDHISTFLFCPTETAIENLRREGFTNVANGGKLVQDPGSLVGHCPSFGVDCSPLVVNVGDVMFESSLYCLETAKRKSDILGFLNLSPKEYLLATVHRVENTDNPERLKSIFESFVALSRKGEKVVIPLHPRTEKALTQLFACSIRSLEAENLKIIRPVSYLDILVLESNAKLIITDSGGVQKEAYFFQVPCVTLRDKTEWVETVESGWNVLVGADTKRILGATLGGFSPCTCVSPRSIYGDGRTGEKIVQVLLNWLVRKAGT